MTRRTIVALLTLLFLALLAALCCVVYRSQVGRILGAIGLGSVNADMTPPNDLALRYEWHAGTMPPPYHYEYIIAVDPELQGAITFYPDYPGVGVPEWHESFAVARADRDSIYALMVRAGLFDRPYDALRDPPVGGDTEWLVVTADGQTVRVPVAAARGDSLRPVYDAIRALVPEDVFDGLMAKRQEYEDNYQE